MRNMIIRSALSLFIFFVLGTTVQAQSFPEAPSAVYASRGRADTFITVKWKPVEGATSYDVFRTSDAQYDAMYNPYVGDRVASEVYGETFLDNDATAGVRYRYQVRPRKGASLGQVSFRGPQDLSLSPNVGWLPVPSSSVPLAIKRVFFVDAASGEEVLGEPITAISQNGYDTRMFDVAKLSKQRLVLKVVPTRPTGSIKITDRNGNSTIDNSESFTIPASDFKNLVASFFYLPLEWTFDYESPSPFNLNSSVNFIYTVTPYTGKNGTGVVGEPYKIQLEPTISR